MAETRARRVPPPRTTIYDVQAAEQIKEEQRRQNRAPRGPRRPAPPKSRWETYEKRVDAQIGKARTAMFFVDTYAYDNGREGSKIRPEGELAKARATIRGAKAEIRAVLAEVAGLHSEIRWGVECPPCPAPAPAAAPADVALECAPVGAAAPAPAPAAGDAPPALGEDAINVEEVACSVCGSYECSDDNDIVMCDRTNCFRAFHVKCCDPPMTAETLGGPDDDWFCHQCTTIDNCVEKVNELWDRDYTCAGWAAVFAVDESDDEDAPAPKGGGFLDMDLGGSDDDDGSFDAAAPAAGSGDDESGDFDASGDDDDDEGSIVSRCSGDEGMGAPPPPVDTIDQANIVEGPRKRARIDYAVLNAALSDCDSDDGGAYYGK